MTYYLNPQINENLCYCPPQSTKVDGFVEMTEEQLKTFLEYNGFVNITVVDGILTNIEPNTDAWEEWKATRPAEPTEPEPTAQDDTDAMLVDHELRITMLELGV